MPFSCYSLAICFFVNVCIYFYFGTSIVLTVLIIILFIFWRAVVNRFSAIVNNRSGFSKRRYIELRTKMWNRSNLNPSERKKIGIDSGLLSDYDSRLGRKRFSLNSVSPLSEKFTSRSPSRSNFKVIKQLSDENHPSRNSVPFADSDMPSPIRSGVSPFRSSPLSYSKRFNVNPEPNFQNSSNNQNFPRVSSVQESNSSKLTPHSFASRSLNYDEDEPSPIPEIMTTANKMGCDQFPWIAYNGTIPMILSSPHQPSTPVAVVNTNSPLSASSFRNRVRVRLSKPDNSNSSLINSTVDNSSSNMSESSTTKSVVQVLKEIARKRCLTTEEEDHQQEGPPLAKRRTEHNLYLSRLEGEEEEASPALPTSTEDERLKRSRDPDWDTLNNLQPKRPRKNYNFYNNEIISSLSSSIGLHPFKQSGRKRSARKSIAIQVQTLVPEEKSEQRKEQLVHHDERSKSPPKTRDTGVVTDPLPESRPRSPVKEKVVSDVNVILKSALSKFDIQPSETKTVGSTSLPLSSSSPFVPLEQSTSVVDSSPATFTPFSSSNPAVSSGVEITSGSFSLATTKTSIATESPSPSPFTVPSSTPQISFGLPDKSLENSKPKEQEENKSENSTKPNQEPVGLKLETTDVIKPDSPFKFGVSQADSLSSPSQSQITSNLFNFKAPEIPPSIQAPVSSTPAFNFGAPKISESNQKVSEEDRNLFQSKLPINTVASLNTSSTSIFSQKNESTPSTGLVVTSSSEQKGAEPLTSSTFNLQSKTSDQVTSSSGVASSIFAFGKTDSKVASENNKPAESKPFQFGSGGFTFGTTNTGNSGGISNSSSLQPVSTSSSVSTSKAVFTFSSSSTNDQKSSGFAFNATTNTNDKQKNLFTFNSSSPSSTTATPSGFGSTTSATSTKPKFPTSLFGSGLANNPLSSVTATNNNTLTSSSSTASTFANVSSNPNPTFSMNPTTTSTPVFSAISTTTTASAFGSTSAAKPVFSSGSNPPPFGASTLSNTAAVFGNNVKENQNKPTVFGSNTTSTTVNPPSFGMGASTPNSIPTFGSVASGNNNTSTFGSTTAVTTNQTVFGGSSAAPGGSTTPFGSSATTNKNVTVFGSSATTNKNVPGFGSGLASGTGSSFSITTTSGTTPSLFSTTSAGTSTPAFGGSGTNNAPPFGTTPSFVNNSSSTFGASAPAFGSSTLTTPNFGTQPQQGFSGQTGTSFGTSSNFGQTSNTPAFGAQNSFGSTSASTPAAFGNPSSSTPAFGSTPNFGSTPAFGSSASTFGSSSGSTATPSFGTSGTPSFGSSTAFGSQDTNKPFTFNAPASQPPAAGTFNFTAPQPQQGSSNSLFQFGGASTSASSSQPFQFNASQSSTPVGGGTGQQMFSIGSGSTAPRRMTARRKK